MNANETRRGKKLEVRAAVTKAVGKLGRSLRCDTAYEDLLDMIVDEVKKSTPATYPVDRRDVSLALRWLCARGIVRISHVDQDTGARVHRISLLRS